MGGEGNVGQVVQPFHDQPIVAHQRGVLALRVFAIRMPAHHDARGILPTEDRAEQGEFFGVFGIGGQIGEESALPYSKIGDAGLHFGSGVSAHDHVVVARTTVEVAIVSPLVNLMIGLAGELTAQINDRL